MPIRSLGYLHWQTPQHAAWRTFATDVIGLMPTLGPDDGSTYLRWDDRPFRLVLSDGDAPGAAAVGFEVADDVELAAAVARLEDAGAKVTPGSAEQAAQRCVSGLARFDDPDGMAVELFYGPVLTHERLVTPLVSGFVTGTMGMGHIVLSVADLASSAELYRNGLGLHLRNTMQFPRPDGGAPFRMQFFGCNRRHHTVGLLDYPTQGNVLHIMIEVATLDDVGYALDRCVDAGVTVVQGLGRHTNDHMVSFYCVSPDGMQVEVGWGGLEVEQAEETTYEITRTSFWGHRPLKA